MNVANNLLSWDISFYFIISMHILRNENGKLEAEELVVLIKRLVEKLGSKLTADHKISIAQQAQGAIDNYGDGETIGWIGFLRLIARYVHHTTYSSYFLATTSYKYLSIKYLETNQVILVSSVAHYNQTMAT